MAWVLELSYPSLGALRTEIDTQLGEGGLYLEAEAPVTLTDEDEVTLRLSAPGIEPIEAAARLVDRSAGSCCVEIDEPVGRALREQAAAWSAAPAEPPVARFSARVGKPGAAPDEALSMARRVAVMSLGEKIQLAHNGAREWRTILARDRAGVIQSALVRNPRIGVEELCALARGPMLAPDAAEALAQHPSFGNSPQIVLALVRNPKTPLPTATQLVSRLLPNDLRTIAKGLGVRAQVAAAARKRLNE